MKNFLLLLLILYITAYIHECEDSSERARARERERMYVESVEAHIRESMSKYPSDDLKKLQDIIGRGGLDRLQLESIDRAVTGRTRSESKFIVSMYDEDISLELYRINRKFRKKGREFLDSF